MRYCFYLRSMWSSEFRKKRERLKFLFSLARFLREPQDLGYLNHWQVLKYRRARDDPASRVKFMTNLSVELTGELLRWAWFLKHELEDRVQALGETLSVKNLWTKKPDLSTISKSLRTNRVIFITSKTSMLHVKTIIWRSKEKKHGAESVIKILSFRESVAIRMGMINPSADAWKHFEWVWAFWEIFFNLDYASVRKQNEIRVRWVSASCKRSLQSTCLRVKAWVRILGKLEGLNIPQCLRLWRRQRRPGHRIRGIYCETIRV